MSVWNSDKAVAMDYKKLKISQNWFLVVLFGVAFGVGYGIQASYSAWQPRLSFASSWVLDLYQTTWGSIQNKVAMLHHVEEDNHRLEVELAFAKERFDEFKFSCEKDKSQLLTKNFESRLNREVGTRIGRTLSSLNYQVPPDLTPPQLHTLGLSYLKAHEDEKAAVIFTVLTSLEDTDVYRNAKDLLITGLAWYRLDNLAAAEKYFDDVLKTTPAPDQLKYQAQARLWKAIISKKAHAGVDTQRWLKELLHHHPQSVEASWINQGGNRNVSKN